MRKLVRKLALGAALAFVASAACADPFDEISGYGTLGVGDIQARQMTLNDVTGRIGARFGDYLGVEGEVSVGVNEQNFVYRPSCVGLVCPAFAFLAKSRLDDAEAGYVVGFLPLAPNADLLARVGYGWSQFGLEPSFIRNPDQQSVNFGVGAQYFFDGINGVRLDYTRSEYQNSGYYGKNVLGSGANLFSVAYTLRF